jgi:hypothetical protein
MRYLPILLALLVLGLVPAAGAGSPTGQSYIVVLQPGSDPEAVAAEHSQLLGVHVGFVYRYALDGLGARPSRRAR